MVVRRKKKKKQRDASTKGESVTAGQRRKKTKHGQQKALRTLRADLLDEAHRDERRLFLSLSCNKGFEHLPTWGTVRV